MPPADPGRFSTLFTGAACALVNIGINPQKLDRLFPELWAGVNLTGLLVLASLSCLALLAFSKLARLTISIIVAAEAMLLLYAASADGNAVWDSFSAKMVFVQILGMSALWLPGSQDWLRQKHR